MPNGEKMQILYNEIDKIAVEFHSNANWNAVDGLVAKINYTDIGLNWDEASSVYHIYRYDHPLYYWFSSTVHTNGTDLIVCAADEYSKGTERALYNKMVYDIIKSYTEQNAQNETSKYQIALGCHDKVIHSIEYAYEPCTMPPLPEDDIWAHNILGVFEMHSGVCESYALTFQLLLNYCGVEGTVVLGYSEEEAHAWNIAKMDDGNWYWFDLTFDDSAYDISYFCLNDIQKIYTNYDDSYTDLNFMDVHTLNSPDNCFGKISSTLPDRNNDVTMNNNGPIDYYSANGWGSWWITSDTGIFKIVGYNAVQFVSTNSSVQNLVIPEKVTFKGRTYDVVSINTRNGGFRSETISSVTIPKSVRLIIEFNAKNLEEIIVDENNPYYTSQDGVLFTKSLYTLIAYPCANTRSSYVVPNEVRHIQDFAFGSIGDACKYLLELTLKNDIIVGVLHWGLPQDDEDWCGTGIHTISIDFQYKVRLAEMLKKGGEVIWIY